MSESMVDELVQDLHELALQTGNGNTPISWKDLTSRQQELIGIIIDRSGDVGGEDNSWGEFRVHVIIDGTLGRSISVIEQAQNPVEN